MTSDTPASVIPLESNPEIFTEFAQKLGASPLLAFHDIFSITEPSLLAMIPRPVYAVVMLFPITAAFEEERKQQDAQSTENGDPSVVWFPQVIRNSCGFYALLHALANMPPELVLKESLLDGFLADLEQKPQDSVKLIENLILHSNDLYQNFSTQGQTQAPAPEESVELHFVTFVKRNGHIYELDGRRKSFLDLGESKTPEAADILEEPAIEQKFSHYLDLAEQDNKLKFSMIGLGPSFD